MSDDIDYPPQVESGEDQPYISRGMFDGLFGHDIIEAPLPFDDTTINKKGFVIPLF